jgi:hypothetical protein
MAKDAPAAKDKPKGDPKAKDAKPKDAKPKDKDKAKADATAAAEAPAKKPEPPPRKPADPRLKLLKKFHGKFLPKGVLRTRHKAIMVRWNSGDDHGGVTVEELRTLLDDWRGTREKPPRIPSA